MHHEGDCSQEAKNFQGLTVVDDGVHVSSDNPGITILVKEPFIQSLGHVTTDHVVLRRIYDHKVGGWGKWISPLEAELIANRTQHESRRVRDHITQVFTTNTEQPPVVLIRHHEAVISQGKHSEFWEILHGSSRH